MDLIEIIRYKIELKADDEAESGQYEKLVQNFTASLPAGGDRAQFGHDSRVFAPGPGSQSVQRPLQKGEKAE